MGKPAVLLIHGFTGHRSSLDVLIPDLERHHFAWHYPILAGHGTTPHDLRDKRWLDWHKDVELGLQYTLQASDHVIIVALSMGTLLAIEMAVEYPDHIAGLILLSPCIEFKNPLARFTPTLAPLIRRMPFHPKEKFSDAEFAKRDQGYRWFPTAPYHSYWKRSRDILRVAESVRCPVQIIQSKNDRVADPRGAQALYEHIAAPKELLWHQRSGHELLLDCEAETIRQEIFHFQPLKNAYA